MNNKQGGRPKLVTLPRLQLNIAILIGGAVGFILQEWLNLDNEGAFVVVILTCSAAVFIGNVAWLIYLRSGQGSA